MSSEKATTRSGRAGCYSARDSFYQCLRECGLLEVKGDIPNKCRQLRAKFESACLPSWVKHFDELQSKRARELKTQYAAINSKATTAAGNLAGTAQK
ncbi:hypothetical protein COO60DRAFT_1480853 [Scenedesmus sp. NREL 46B-D3]|nr:hypothetical protein COO60DRAFT_1480853 [Scenedesmus sp. NREL 46B-D3]